MSILWHDTRSLNLYPTVFGVCQSGWAELLFPECFWLGWATQDSLWAIVMVEVKQWPSYSLTPGRLPISLPHWYAGPDLQLFPSLWFPFRNLSDSWARSKGTDICRTHIINIRSNKNGPRFQSIFMSAAFACVPAHSCFPRAPNYFPSIFPLLTTCFLDLKLQHHTETAAHLTCLTDFHNCRRPNSSARV